MPRAEFFDSIAKPMYTQISFPILITNFKAYENATGPRALELAKIHEKVAKEEGVSIACAVQAPDIFRIAREVMIPIFAQHFDIHPHGQHTGAILPEAIQLAGAAGSLLNHSEFRIPFPDLAESLNRAAFCKLFVVVCAHDHEEAKIIAALKPDAVAVEPPELIGGNISVSTAKPALIERSVKEAGNVPLIVGAGVKSGEDVKKALSLGAQGILLASGITKADNPERTLRELVRAMKPAHSQ